MYIWGERVVFLGFVLLFCFRFWGLREQAEGYSFSSELADVRIAFRLAVIKHRVCGV